MKFTDEAPKTEKVPMSAEELLVLAREHNTELTEELAIKYAAKLRAEGQALSDEELDNVAGGGCGSGSGQCRKCGGMFIRTDERREFPRSNGSSCLLPVYRCLSCGFDSVIP